MGYFLTFLAGVALTVAAVLFWQWRPGVFRRGFGRVLRASRVSREEDDRAVPGAAADELEMVVSDLTAELRETADEAVQRLEHASAELRSLLEKAEYQKARLERAVNAARGAKPQAGGQTARELELAPELAPATDREPGEGPRRADRQRILELAAEGMAVGEIAQRMGVGKGEVGLIINMARRKERKGSPERKGGGT